MAFFIIKNFKLVANTNCYAVHISSPTHACSGYEPRPQLFVDMYAAVVIIWQAQNGDPIRAYRSSKTPDKYMYMYVFSVIHKARGDTQASAGRSKRRNEEIRNVKRRNEDIR